MKKLTALVVLGLWMCMSPVQAQEIDIINTGEVVALGIIPNPIKVATKVITAPAKAAKKKIDTVRKVAKVGKKASKLGQDKDEAKRNGDIGDKSDMVVKNKKQQDKEFEAWKKGRDQELENIAKEKAERDRLRRELGIETEESSNQHPQVKPDDAVEVTPAEAERSAEASPASKEKPEAQNK